MGSLLLRGLLFVTWAAGSIPACGCAGVCARTASVGFFCEFHVAGVYFWYTNPESDFPTDGRFLPVVLLVRVLARHL